MIQALQMFFFCSQTLGTDKHVVTAVAARSLDSAKSFAQDFGIAKFYDRYEALGGDADVGELEIVSVNMIKKYL